MRRETEDPFILSGLDIGTRKISFVVTETDPVSFEMQVISISASRSRGIRKGDILDPDLCVASIQEVIDEAESALGLHVYDTVISFGPPQSDSLILDQTITLHEEGIPEKSVTSSDMKKAVEATIAVAKTKSKECLLHAIPLSYSVDGGHPTSDPRGYKGTELTVSLLTVFVPESSVLAVIECAEKAGLRVKGIIHKSISTAFGSLLPEEMQTGSVAVDIGAGTTSVTICNGGSIRDIAQFPIGGDHITNDIANVLDIPLSKAEYLKREVSLVEGKDSLDDELEFDVEGKAFITSVEEVLDIILPRVEEILKDFLQPWIKSCSPVESGGTIVFSGGVATSPGFMTVVDEIFQCRARIGTPVGMSSLPPKGRGSEFVSSVGIFNYINERDENQGSYLEPFFAEMPEEIEASGRIEKQRGVPAKNMHPFRKNKRGKGFFTGLIQELKHAFRELF